MQYQIMDEPKPGPMGHLVVRPLWPFFALMFAGSWLAFPWFAFNGFAVGCPNRVKTLLIAIGAMVFAFGSTFGLLYLHETLGWDIYTFRYSLLVVLVGKFAFGYWLMIEQSQTFELYTHFGGQVRNGVLVIVLAYFIRGNFYEKMPLLFIW